MSLPGLTRSGMTIEWTDLSFHEATQGSAALLVFPVSVLLAFLVLAALVCANGRHFRICALARRQHQPASAACSLSGATQAFCSSELVTHRERK
jgi:hypothetical protein